MWGLNPLKRPIEVTFPLDNVNKIAEMESTGFGRRHYRPVYVMHKWWARRLGSIFRALLLYSLADKDLQGWDGEPESLQDFYARDVDLGGKKVLDPMMGGGTTIVEALRLGCKVIGGDLNPVAWFVVKKSVEDINPIGLSRALSEIEIDLGEDLRKYYRTVCPECGNDAEGIYYFYCKEVLCPECANVIPLMHSYFLARSPSEHGDCVVCPHCWNVFLTKNAKKSSKCPKCERIFTATEESLVSGRTFRCKNSSCRPHSIISVVRESGKRPAERLYAVEFYCKHCDESRNRKLKSGRGYKSADSNDLVLLNAANAEFRRIRDTLPLPDVIIPLGVETRRAINHGYRNFQDMFNARQLLNLGKIYRWILGVEDWNLREFLILAFSNCLKYNNMFAKYNATRGFITDIFRTHSFSPSMSPVEANCYDTPKGRGSFTAFVKLVIEGKEYCREPFERIFHAKSMKKVSLQNKIDGKLARDYADLQDTANVLLQCGSSETIPIPDKSVDAVVTDPPYFGNVMYSELSNFFYVWLKLGLKERYKEFSAEYVPWIDEVIENKAQKKGREEYVQGLTKVFLECNRVLVHDGILVFTFHHTRLAAWGALLEALLASNFYVTATYPVRSEMKASTHLHEMENIIYDMVFVCRKKSARASTLHWSTLQSHVVQSVTATVKQLQRNGQVINKQDLFAMILGRWLQVYSRHFPNVKIRECEVTPNIALSLIEEGITDTIQSIIRGSL